jgi:hypothetical protein
MDFDLIASGFDAFDQAGKEDTLTYCGQPGPAVPEFSGSHDEPVLR